MFIREIEEIKRLINNNIQLSKVANKFQSDRADPNVQSLIKAIPTNIDSFPLWYSMINSLFSSISLVNEYILNQNDDLNNLDTSFTLNKWKISSCHQYDDSNRKDNSTIDLNTLLRRTRNSISHGKFKVNKSKSIASFWNVEFYDSNDRKKKDDTKKNFCLSIKVTDLIHFLECVEDGFNKMYP